MVEVGATNGNNFLGGQNYDSRIVDWVVSEFKKDKGVDLSKDPMAFSRIIEAAEKAKCELSTSTSTEINLPYITSIDNTPQFLLMTLTRAKMEDLTRDLTEEVKELALGCIKKAGKTESDIDEILLIGGATRMLSVQEALESTGIKLNKSSNPDEAVALGAAIQANQLATGGTDLLLLDVTPLSLGIETLGGVFTKMIEANTTIPTHKEETFSTAADNQPSVTISIYQGERPLCADNKLIGNFNLDGIMPAPRGVPQILVSFDIDANGILKVTAKDKATGKEQNVRVEAQSGLSKDEIDRIKAEAEAHKSEDAKKEADIQKLNQAESTAYGLEDALKQAGDKITEEEKASVQPKIDKLKDIVKNRKADEVDAAMEEVNKAFEPIARKLYAQQAPQPEQGPQAAPESGDDQKVEEADFEEVK
jgi:molecular chaperone DnaK